MSNRLADTSAEYKQIDALLRKDMPLYRKAYSDRTAWLMACFAELAYARFNPFFIDATHKDYFVKTVSKLAGEKKVQSLLKLVDSLAYDHADEKKTLIEEIGVLKCELAKTFDKNGTQAILVSNEKYLVLAFRGTEATSMTDIKADLKAKTTPVENNEKIHTGFKDAYNEIGNIIQQTLDQEKLKNKPLFITGHSLGGALATIAAKMLDHKGGVAACYTFGSPRVGNPAWVSTIKSPVYRVVNAADGVTMVPPGGPVIGIARWVAGFVPCVGAMLRSWLSSYANYAHAGDMRYLTNCPKGKYAGVKLLYSVNLFFRIQGLYQARKPMAGFLADHKMSIYRKKLMIIAEQRNQK